MKKSCKLWAFSYKFDGVRALLGPYCFPDRSVANCIRHLNVPVALFATRKAAREANLDCCYKGARIERVFVTITADSGK